MISPITMKNGIASIVKLFTPSSIMRIIVVGFVPGTNSADANAAISIENVTGTLRSMRPMNPARSTIAAGMFVII